jgi:TldD protein
VVLVARADGTRAADVRPLVRVSVTVIAEQDGRREVGTGGGGGRFGLGYFQRRRDRGLRRRRRSTPR